MSTAAVHRYCRSQTVTKAVPFAQTGCVAERTIFLESDPFAAASTSQNWREVPCATPIFAPPGARPVAVTVRTVRPGKMPVPGFTARVSGVACPLELGDGDGAVEGLGCAPDT